MFLVVDQCIVHNFLVTTRCMHHMFHCTCYHQKIGTSRAKNQNGHTR